MALAHACRTACVLPDAASTSEVHLKAKERRGNCILPWPRASPHGLQHNHRKLRSESLSKPSLLEHLSLVAAGLRLRGSSPPAAAPVLFAATDAVRCRGTLRLLGPGTELLPKHPQLHLAGKSANSPATAAEMDTVVASTPRGRQPAQVAKSGTSCPLT